MIVKELHVKRFRSILDEKLACDSLTALVGKNGSGKSSFLRALELFYDHTAKPTAEDYYNEDTSQDIEFALTYSNLTAEEKAFFAAYIDSDTLTVVRVFSLAPGGKSGTYHGMRLQNPEFTVVRDAGSKTDIKNKYDELRGTPKYSSLPVARSADKVLEGLSQWETENRADCVRLRDDGQFFGFTEVAQGYLGRYTRFIHVPAVRDAYEDATERKGSCITEIMDLVVRSVLSSREDVVNFKRETQAKHKEIFDPESLVELTQLETRLGETLRQYAPDAGVSLEWAELTPMEIPMPKADIKLIEDGYAATIQRTGHGLQRAFIMTMLQHLVAAREINRAARSAATSGASTGASPVTQLPSLILAVEEPELYQHPSRQRHIASVLFKLAQGEIPGVARKTQVAYSTHSPVFVGLDRFDNIRLVRKKSEERAKPKVTRIANADLQAVAEEIWDACGRPGTPFTAETLRPRLQSVMTPWVNEGFFADVAVLVEGEDDRAAIMGTASAAGHDMDRLGVAVIPCLGKNNLDRPLVILRRLGIPTYVIWDSDFERDGARPEDNRRLLRLMGLPEEDWPCLTGDSCACFKTKLESTTSTEIGSEVFDRLVREQQEQFGIPKKEDALKNPVVFRRLVELAAEEGKKSETLDAILEKILALRMPEDSAEPPAEQGSSGPSSLSTDTVNTID